MKEENGLENRVKVIEGVIIAGLFVIVFGMGLLMGMLN